MVRLYLIRHGKTYGNTLRRYIGKTDEPLCEAGIEELSRAPRPKVQKVYASPMKRCIETAGILFPDHRPVIINDFREIDFGDFENKNYKELDGNSDYQAFVDSGATLPFPNGESREEFQERCIRGFGEMLEDLERCFGTDTDLNVALTVHGGTIMSILWAYSDPKEDYFYWQAENGGGFECTLEIREDGGIRLYDIQHIGPDSGLPA